MVRFEKLTADRYQGWDLAVAKDFEQLAKEHTFRRHWYEDDGGHFGLVRESRQRLRPKDR